MAAALGIFGACKNDTIELHSIEYRVACDTCHLTYYTPLLHIEHGHDVIFGNWSHTVNDLSTGTEIFFRAVHPLDSLETNTLEMAIYLDGAPWRSYSQQHFNDTLNHELSDRIP